MESVMIPISRLDPPLNFPDLSRYWKLLLFSDGSMTRNLEALTQSIVSIEILSETELKNDSELEILLKENYSFLEKPVIQRKVLIKNSKSEVLIKATSLWNSNDYALIMKDKADAIGNNIIKFKHEYFREILNVNLLPSSNPQESLKFRCYFIHHNRKILTYIEETFLPDLEKYLIN